MTGSERDPTVGPDFMPGLCACRAWSGTPRPIGYGLLRQMHEGLNHDMCPSPRTAITTACACDACTHTHATPGRARRVARCKSIVLAVADMQRKHMKSEHQIQGMSSRAARLLLHP